MTTAAPYLDNFTTDLDYEPKCRFLSPSHKSMESFQERNGNNDDFQR